MSDDQKDSGAGKKFAGIVIPPDLKWSNFFNMYLATLLIGCITVVPVVLQPAFLKEIINIPEEQAGSINAGLMNMSQIATILFIGLIGILSDKVGRRILAIIGFLICGIGYMLFGHAKDISLAMGITSLEGQIFVTYIIRFLLGIGLILGYPQFITLVADYTYERDRGKGMAINGIMMGMGAIVVFGVLVQIAGKTGLMSLFYMSGILGFAGAFITRLWLVDRLPKERPKRLGIKETYSAVSKNFALKVSYVAAFVVRSDVIVTGTFLIVWMVYVADRFGMSPVKASAQGGVAGMVMSAASFVVFPIAGVLIDRWGRVPVLIAGLLFAGIGFCLTGIVENPFSPVLYLCVSFIGIGVAGSLPGTNTLASDASPRQLLGSILGGLNTMAPFGIFFFLQVGGFLFDKVGCAAPFILKGAANLVCGLWILMVKNRIVLPKEDERTLT